MKKVLFLIAVLAAGLTLTSFVINRSSQNKGIGDEWKFGYQTQAVDDNGTTWTLYCFYKYENSRGERDGWGCTKYAGTYPRSENIYANPYKYDKYDERDFRSKYDLVGYPDGNSKMGYYFHNKRR